MSSPILGSVVFDLPFLNEVTRQHETFTDIGAQVLDELIILFAKNPLYFDEIPRSKPDLSQPVESVKTPVTAIFYASRRTIRCRTIRNSPTD